MGWTICTLCCVQGQPNIKSTLDGWRSAGKHCTFFLFYYFLALLHVYLLMYHDSKNRWDCETIKSFFFFHTSVWHKHIANDAFCFNYIDWPHWLFCQMPSHSVLGLLIWQSANYKQAAKDAARGLSHHCLYKKNKKIIVWVVKKKLWAVCMQWH